MLTPKFGVLNRNMQKKLAASSRTPKSITFFRPTLLDMIPTGINEISAPTEATIRAPANPPPSMPHISVAYFENAVVTALYAIYQKATDKSRNTRLRFTGFGRNVLPFSSVISSSSSMPHSFSLAIRSATNLFSSTLVRIIIRESIIITAIAMNRGS